jgi:hypothetical protein
MQRVRPGAEVKEVPIVAVDKPGAKTGNTAPPASSAN